MYAFLFTTLCVPKVTAMPAGVLTGTQVEACEFSVPEPACVQDWHLYSAVPGSRARGIGPSLHLLGHCWSRQDPVSQLS